MKTKWNMRPVCVVTFCAAMLTHSGSYAQLPVVDLDDDGRWLSVLQEVLDACTLTQFSDAYKFTPRSFKSQSDWQRFRNNSAVFEQVQRLPAGKCWTRDRWQRYVDARLDFAVRINFAAQERQSKAVK